MNVVIYPFSQIDNPSTGLAGNRFQMSWWVAARAECCATWKMSLSHEWLSGIEWTWLSLLTAVKHGLRKPRMQLAREHVSRLMLPTKNGKGNTGRACDVWADFDGFPCL